MFESKSNEVESRYLPEKVTSLQVESSVQKSTSVESKLLLLLAYAKKKYGLQVASLVSLTKRYSQEGDENADTFPPSY